MNEAEDADRIIIFFSPLGAVWQLHSSFSAAPQLPAPPVCDPCWVHWCRWFGWAADFAPNTGKLPSGSSLASLVLYPSKLIYSPLNQPINSWTRVLSPFLDKWTLSVSNRPDEQERNKDKQKHMNTCKVSNQVTVLMIDIENYRQFS